MRQWHRLSVSRVQGTVYATEEETAPKQLVGSSWQVAGYSSISEATAGDSWQASSCSLKPSTLTSRTSSLQNPNSDSKIHVKERKSEKLVSPCPDISVRQNRAPPQKLSGCTDSSLWNWKLGLTITEMRRFNFLGAPSANVPKGLHSTAETDHHSTDRK